MNDTIVVNLKSGKGKYTWFLPPPHPSYSISVSPATGSWKKVFFPPSTFHSLIYTVLCIERRICLHCHFKFEIDHVFARSHLFGCCGYLFCFPPSLSPFLQLLSLFLLHPPCLPKTTLPLPFISPTLPFLAPSFFLFYGPTVLSISSPFQFSDHSFHNPLAQQGCTAFASLSTLDFLFSPCF